MANDDEVTGDEHGPATGQFTQIFIHGVNSGKDFVEKEWVNGLGGTHDDRHVLEWRSDAGYTFRPLDAITPGDRAERIFNEETDKIARRIADTYHQDGNPVLLHGHSAGGVMASAVVDRLKEMDVPVAGIITYGTPANDLRFHGVGYPTDVPVLAISHNKDEIMAADGTQPGAVMPGDTPNVKRIWVTDTVEVDGPDLDHTMPNYAHNPKVNAWVQKFAAREDVGRDLDRGDHAEAGGGEHVEPRVWYDPDDKDGYVNVSKGEGDYERMSLDEAKSRGLVDPDAEVGDLRQYKWADHKDGFEAGGAADGVHEAEKEAADAVEPVKDRADEAERLLEQIERASESAQGLVGDAQTASESARQLQRDAEEASQSAQEEIGKAQEASNAAAQDAAEAEQNSTTAQSEAKETEQASELAQKHGKDAERWGDTAQDEGREAEQAGELARREAKEAEQASAAADKCAKEAEQAADTAQAEAKEAQATVPLAEQARKTAAGHLADAAKLKAQVEKVLQEAAKLQDAVQTKLSEGEGVQQEVEDALDRGKSDGHGRLRDTQQDERETGSERNETERARDGAQNAERDADNHERQAEECARRVAQHEDRSRREGERARANLQEVIRLVEKARSMM